MPNVLVVNGPNLNMLGNRETDVYGDVNLETINKSIIEEGARLGLEIDTFQSNDEGEIVNKIQEVQKSYDALVINPAAFSHYSIAIRDAVASVNKPTIEVHLSNIYAREEFRQKSVVSAVAHGVISGFGPHGYILALQAVKSLLAS